VAETLRFSRAYLNLKSNNTDRAPFQWSFSDLRPVCGVPLSSWKTSYELKASGCVDKLTGLAIIATAFALMPL